MLGKGNPTLFVLFGVGCLVVVVVVVVVVVQDESACPILLPLGAAVVLRAVSCHNVAVCVCVILVGSSHGAGAAKRAAADLPPTVHTASTPLSGAHDWFHVKCPCCGGPATRDPDTLDTFVDSSWYYARYLAPKDAGQVVPPALAEQWLPVDFYVGGVEHAILHLLYARFFHKFMQSEVRVSVGRLRGSVPCAAIPVLPWALGGRVLVACLVVVARAGACW
jgi:hypothetical protein